MPLGSLGWGYSSCQDRAHPEDESPPEPSAVHQQAFGRMAEPRRAGTMVLARTQGATGLWKTKVHAIPGRLDELDDVRGSGWRLAARGGNRLAQDLGLIALGRVPFHLTPNRFCFA